jgi:hypothetical protein
MEPEILLRNSKEFSIESYPDPFIFKNLNIIFPSMPNFPTCLLTLFSDKNILHISYLSDECYMSHPFHPPRFHYIRII